MVEAGGDKATLTFIVITGEAVSHEEKEKGKGARVDRSFYEEKRGWFKGGIEKMVRARRKQKNRKRLAEEGG